MFEATTGTRRLLSRFAFVTLAVAGALLATRPGAELQAAPAAVSADSPHDAWLLKLKGQYRQLFDAPAPAGGIPLVHVMNYYDTYNTAYGVPDRQVNAVLTFYGSTTFHGLSDAMWAKYELGEFLGEKDAAGKAYVANPWRANPTIIGMELPQASIEALQKRGATFIICNNALTIFSGLVAKARGLAPEVVYADMKAHILPDVTLVPGMVIAIDKAQRAGLSYHRQ